MPYIGKQPTIGNFQVCDAISVVNGQAAYTLQVGGVNVAPESANHMLVSLNGILQKPGSSFTISGSTMTFASNLATGDVIDFVQILGNVLDLGSPSDDTVTAAKLNDNIISGQTALTSAPDSTDELLISDGGTLKRIDVSLVGGTNTPTFEARLASNMTGLFASTNTLVTFDTEKFDVGSCFNNTTSSTTLNGLTAPAHSFTPNVSGKYFVYGILRTDAATTFPNDAYVKIYKNGSQVEQQQNASTGSRNVTTIQRTVELNGTGDYIQLYGIAYGSSGLIFSGTTNGCYFGAYKIIE